MQEDVVVNQPSNHTVEEWQAVSDSFFRKRSTMEGARVLRGWTKDSIVSRNEYESAIEEYLSHTVVN